MRTVKLPDGMTMRVDDIKVDRGIYTYKLVCDHLVSGCLDHERCEIKLWPEGISTNCSGGDDCLHLFPAMSAGLGAERIASILELEGGRSVQAVVPLFFLGNELVKASVKLNRIDTAAGKFAEVVIDTPVKGAGQNTVLYTAGGKMYHSIGVVGHGENYDTIKTMISAWCLYMSNDILDSDVRKEGPYASCMSHRHRSFLDNETRANSLASEKKDLALFALTGLCPVCRRIEKVKLEDVPVPF